MTTTSDTRLLLLHTLRLKGFADVHAIANHAGMYPSEVQNFLEHLRIAELVVHRDGRLSGWALTPAGRQRHAELLAAEVEGSGVRDRVHASYEAFGPLNGELLAVCTDWQMRTVGGQQLLNDHSDPGYDRKVVDRLEKVDVAIQPICAELTRALGRFATYGPRLTTALERVRRGDTDWFTKPIIDSYHTVWFELHEDLLATLGIERAKEEV